MNLAPVTDATLAVAESLRDQAIAAGEPAAVTRLSPPARSAYDRAVDALNRLPRPVMVLGSLALLLSALLAPAWFDARMEALARMPEALWWLIGAVLSLHFGARFQDRSQQLTREIAAALPPPVLAVPAPEASPGTDADLVLATLAPAENPALEAWRAQA